MRRVVVVALAIALVVAITTNTPAGADSWAGGGGGGDPWVYVSQPGQPFPGGYGPGDGDGGTGIVTCHLFAPLSSGLGMVIVTQPLAGAVYVLWCRDGTGQTVVFEVIQYDPGTWLIGGKDLAHDAYDQLPLVYPDPQTSPGIWSDQLVGVATWLWIPASEWTVRSATASAGGLSATVTATPKRVVWSMGDGAEVVCAGPGTPYDIGRPDADQSTTCSHTYGLSSVSETDERFPVSAVIVWSVRWTATDGSGGVLPDAWRGARLSLRVAEAQALRTPRAGG